MRKIFTKLNICLIVPSLLVLAGCGGGETDSKPAPTDSSSSSSAASPAPAANDIQERTVKAGLPVPKDSTLGQGLDKFAELVAQKSDGKIKVQNFYDSTLGDDKKMAEALQAGLQEIAITNSSIMVGNVKELGVIDFPFMFNDEKHAHQVLDGPFGRKLLDGLTPQGLIGLTFWENGFRSVTNSKHPIETADDLKGLKIRTIQNPVHIEVFKSLGANPTPMPWPEVFPALESHAIDGQENPVTIVASSSLNEVQKYMSFTKHLYSPMLFMVSQKFWDQLSDAEKKVFQEAAVEAGAYQRDLNLKSSEALTEELKAKGMQFNDIAPEEREKMKEMSKPALEPFIKDIGEDVVQEFFDELEKAK